MTNSTCKECPERSPGCHDRCERFKAWQQLHQAERAYTYDMTHTMSCYHRTYEDRHRERGKKKYFGQNEGDK